MFEWKYVKGVPPATLFEFTLNGYAGQDFYDVSNVDGYNIQMSVEVVSPSPPPAGGDPTYWCQNPACIKDLNSICPPELQEVDAAGKVVACLSACAKFNTDQYCCRGAYNSPQTCIAANWPVDYAAIFKQACPQAYSYAYDDKSSTFCCRNTDYNLVFC